MRRLLSWTTTLLFLPAFGLTLLVFDIAGRLVRPVSLRAFEVVMGALQRTLTSLFSICGTRIEMEKHADIESNRGYVIISNHQSLFDITMIGGFLFTNYPKYVAKTELGRWIPSVSLNLRRGGNALIDRKDRDQAVEAITEMARIAQDRNVSVVIFPEGTRSPDGTLKRFRRAGTVALLEAADRLPVIPTAIDGSWRLNSMTPVPFGTRVRIRFGQPIARRPDDAGDVLAAARRQIADTMDRWKVDRPSSGRSDQLEDEPVSGVGVDWVENEGAD